VAASGEDKRKVVSAAAWREEIEGPEIETILVWSGLVS